MEHEVIKFASLKKKNRRIKLVVLKDKNGSHTVIIETKRLIDFKTRNILTWDGVMGIETFDAIAGIFDLLKADAEFKKSANREIGQARKDRFQCSTNIQF